MPNDDSQTNPLTPSTAPQAPSDDIGGSIDDTDKSTALPTPSPPIQTTTPPPPPAQPPIQPPMQPPAQPPKVPPPSPAPQTQPDKGNQDQDAVAQNTDSKDPETVITSPQVPKKYGGTKVIATIFGIILLVSAIGAGVFLVGQQQEIRIGAWDCKTYVFELSQTGVVTVRNGSRRNEPPQKAKVYINGQHIATCDVPRLNSGDAATICTVPVPQTSFSWKVVGTVDCENSGSHQITPTPSPSPTPTPSPTEGPTPTISPSPTPTCTPTPTPTPPPIGAACLDVKAFDEQWNQLSASDLANLKTGNLVRFAVGGTTSSGSFDKAKFTINGTQKAEVTSKRPGTDEFYDEYLIPEGVTDFTISAQIHHTVLGWF